MAHESTLSKRGRFWLGHIQQWQPLGVTQVEYCRAHKISVAAFKWWRGRLAKRGFHTEASLTLTKKASKRPAFVELTKSHTATVAHRYEIHFGSDRRLSIAQGFDSQEVAELVSILEPSC